MTQQRGRDGTRVFRRNPHVDDTHGAGLHIANRCIERGFERCRVTNRSVTGCALPARELGEIQRRIVHSQSDPAILDRPRAHPRHPLLMQLVVEKRLIVRYDDQQRNPIVNAGPQCRQSHQIVAVAEYRNGQAAGAAQCQRRADGHSGARSDTTSPIEADEVQRLREAAVLTRPTERQADIRRLVCGERGGRHARHVGDRDASVARRARSVVTFSGRRSRCASRR